MQKQGRGPAIKPTDRSLIKNQPIYVHEWVVVEETTKITLKA
jgi:hypothetical protein